MANNKPTLVFGRMLGCGPCTAFPTKPTPETSPWATLVRDAELQSKVNFVLMEWGVEKDPQTGALVQHKRAPGFDFINYGPYFYLHAPRASTDAPVVGKEFKAGEGGYQRTPADMKRWILDTLKANPQLVQVAAKPAPQVTAVPTPTQFTRSTLMKPRAEPPSAYFPPQPVAQVAPQAAYFPPQPVAQAAPLMAVQAAATEPKPARFIPRNRRGKK